MYREPIQLWLLDGSNGLGGSMLTSVWFWIAFTVFNIIGIIMFIRYTANREGLSWNRVDRSMCLLCGPAVWIMVSIFFFVCLAVKFTSQMVKKAELEDKIRSIED